MNVNKMNPMNTMNPMNASEPMHGGDCDCPPGCCPGGAAGDEAMEEACDCPPGCCDGIVG